MLVVSEHEQLPVREARAGEPDAWTILLARYRLPLYSYVFGCVHHEQTALDIVQETFINAARHLASLRDDHKFGSWLFNIAHQKCAQHWRKKRLPEVTLDPQDEDLAEADLGPVELLIREEQEQEFMSILNQLAAPHRAVVLLHFIEEFSLEEIAQITGTPVGTVKSRLHYARKTLKKLLEERS